MAAELSLVAGAQEQAAEELVFQAKVEILAGGIFHVPVHGADGDPFPRVRDGAVRTAGVVRSADGRRIGVKNGIAKIRLEVNQSVERGVPSAVGPDVVEDAIVVDAVAAAHRRLPASKRIPGKTDARSKVMISRFPHAADRTDARVGDTSAVKDTAASVAEVCKLRQDTVSFARSAKPLPAKSEVEGQPRGDIPVVLNERGVVVVGVVAVSVCLVGGGNAGVYGCLLKIGVIAREIGVALVGDTSDRAVGLQRAVTPRREH